MEWGQKGRGREKKGVRWSGSSKIDYSHYISKHARFKPNERPIQLIEQIIQNIPFLIFQFLQKRVSRFFIGFDKTFSLDVSVIQNKITALLLIEGSS